MKKVLPLFVLLFDSSGRDCVKNESQVLRKACDASAPVEAKATTRQTTD